MSEALNLLQTRPAHRRNSATAFHFGESRRALYGVYHPAEKRIARAPAALLFNPFGEEAIRAHRMFKILAERFARAGVATLRFDYYGSGDSAGDDGDVTISGMVADAGLAQEELEDLSSARRFVWVGLGLGASVALKAASQTRTKLEHLTLWDPVIFGWDYLGALRDAHIAYLAYALDEPIDAIRKKAPAKISEALGFALSPMLQKELEVLDVTRAAPPSARHVSLITGAAPTPPAFLNWLHEGRGELNAHADAAKSWNSNDAMNAHHVPSEMLNLIVTETVGAS